MSSLRKLMCELSVSLSYTAHYSQTESNKTACVIRRGALGLLFRGKPDTFSQTQGLIVVRGTGNTCEWVNMPVLTYLLRGIADNIVKKCLQVHFPTLNRIVKCTGTRISASRVHRQHHPMYPATDICFFCRRQDDECVKKQGLLCSRYIGTHFPCTRNWKKPIRYILAF